MPLTALHNQGSAGELMVVFSLWLEQIDECCMCLLKPQINVNMLMENLYIVPFFFFYILELFAGLIKQESIKV